MVEVLVNLVLLAVAVFLIAKAVPAIHIKGFGTAVVVAVVYSVINFLLGRILLFLTFPLVLITFGLFKVVVNAVLLWITDKLVRGFEIKGFGWTVVAAALITVADMVLQRLL